MHFISKLGLVALCLAAALGAGCGSAPTALPQPTRVMRTVALPPPAVPSSWDELQQQFARRLVDAHPDDTYSHAAPDRLLAIPVLEVELNGDGSVRRIVVLRKPTTDEEGTEATALAIAAVRKAAPYGNVSRLKRPWIVTESFLFDDDMRFKPRTLDID